MDAVKPSAEFRRRRTLNRMLAGTMYAFVYMARYNFSSINALRVLALKYSGRPRPHSQFSPPTKRNVHNAST